MALTWAKRIALSRFLWLMAGVVALGIWADRWMEAEGGARVVVERWGLWGPLVSLVLKTVTSMTPIGAVVLSVVNGAVFDFWTSVTINLLSGVFGGIAMYFVWRRGDHEFDIQARTRQLPEWFHRHAGDNLLFLTVLRIFPWAGGSLADLVAGSHRVPLTTHVASLLLGYLPGAVLYTLLGAGLVGG